LCSVDLKRTAGFRLVRFIVFHGFMRRVGIRLFGMSDGCYLHHLVALPDRQDIRLHHETTGAGDQPGRPDFRVVRKQLTCLLHSGDDLFCRCGIEIGDVSDLGQKPVCTENLIRVDEVMESPKLVE
jgi:hypothetical protein